VNDGGSDAPLDARSNSLFRRFGIGVLIVGEALVALSLLGR
jgi:hypothetical protein